MKALNVINDVSCLCVALLLVGVSGAEAEDVGGIVGDFSYIVEDGNIIIEAYNGSDSIVTVPASIQELPVTTIGSGAFAYNMNLQEVILPETITSVCMEAFGYCRNLTTLSFGGNEKELADYAFYGCNNLSNLVFPNTLEKVGCYAFCGCESIEELVLPEDVTVLSYGVFYQCRDLKKVTLAESTTTIEASAFGQCVSLEGVYIPASVTSIDGTAFTGCSSLARIDVDGDNETYWNTEDGVLFTKDKDKLLCCPCNYQASTFVIPETLVNIQTGAFSGCTNLLNFEVAAANPAFKSVDGFLMSIDGTSLIVAPAGRTGAQVVPDGVVRIEADAFNGMSDVEVIICPATVNFLGSRAFWYCRKLLRVAFKGNAPTCDDIPPFYATMPSMEVYYLNGTTGWESQYSGYVARAAKNDQTPTFPTMPVTTATYGDSGFTVSGSVSSKLSVSFMTDNPNVAIIDDKNVQILNAGEVNISLYQKGAYRGGAYHFPVVSKSQKLIVLPKTATINVSNAEVENGMPLPEFTYTAEGLLDGDVIGDNVRYTVDGVPTEEIKCLWTPGDYLLRIIDANLNPNYAFTINPGVLSVKNTLVPSLSYTLEGGQMVITYTGVLQKSTDGGVTWLDVAPVGRELIFVSEMTEVKECYRAIVDFETRVSSIEE